MAIHCPVARKRVPTALRLPAVAAATTLVIAPWSPTADDEPTTSAPAPVVATAAPGIPLMSLPPSSSFDGNFEDTTVAAGALVLNPTTWGNWSFGGRSGIAHEAHPVAASNGPAPLDDRVAVLPGTSTISVTASLAAGVYRVKFRAARRLQGSTLDDQGLVIEVGGSVISNEEDLTGAYGSFVSRPILLGGGNHTFQFSGTGALTASVLLDDVALEPIREWNDNATWSTPTPPAVGDIAVIPVGSTVAITGDATTGKVQCFGNLVVPDVDATFEAESVLVSGLRAYFEIGRRGVPFDAAHDFTLVLTETVTPGGNHKFLIARDRARLEAHGAPKTSWTRITSSAPTGASQIVVEDTTGWDVGDQIVVAPSIGQSLPGVSSNGWVHLSERFAIRSLVGNTVSLGRPDAPATPATLRSPRVGVETSYSNGSRSWDVDLRAEVGMLSHNVTIRGTEASSPNGNDHTGFGGHIMIARAPGGPDSTSGRARISGIELTQMGQTGELGRYPMHWHRCKDYGAGQYILDCSIHDTFNRAVTVHATDETLVGNNVAYSNLGHAFFLEDGSEEDNTMWGNLSLVARKPEREDAVLLSDSILDQFQNRTPSAYWITNPKNTFLGNVAADTIGTGFWFALPRTVLGDSFPHGGPSSDPHNAMNSPRLLDLTAFEDNVAHGCRNGIDLHDGVNADTSIDKNFAWTPASGAAVLEDFTGYACQTAIYSGDGESGGEIFFRNAVLVDNEIGVRFASDETVEESLFVADTGNGVYPSLQPGREFEAYRLYDGAGIVDDCYFVGYHAAGTTLLNSNGAAIRRTNHVFRAVSFDQPGLPNVELPDFSSAPQNGTVLPNNDAQEPGNPRSWGYSVYDEDGTLTGTAGTSVIPAHKWMRDGNEVPYVNPTGNPSNAYLSQNKFGHLYIRHPLQGNQPGLVTFTRRRAGQPDYDFNDHYTVDQQKQVPVILDQGYVYVVDWNGGASLPSPSSSGPELLLKVGNLDPDDSVILLLELGQTGTTISNAVQTTDINDLRFPSPGDPPTYFVDASGDVYFLVKNPGTDFFEIDW